jgi:hypothetical protein
VPQYFWGNTLLILRKNRLSEITDPTLLIPLGSSRRAAKAFCVRLIERGIIRITASDENVRRLLPFIQQHPHDFTFQPATCDAPAFCACGQSYGEPLGCSDNDGDDLCDACGKNVKYVYEYVAIRTDNNSGVIDTAAGTYTWGNDNFEIQVLKGTSSQLYSTAKDHMRLYKGNQLVITNKNGYKVSTITVFLTNATQVTNFEKFLTGYTYTMDTENFTITVEINSTESLTFTNTGSTTQIKGIEFGYEKVSA